VAYLRVDAFQKVVEMFIAKPAIHGCRKRSLIISALVVSKSKKKSLHISL
jgi:hypothetical protein